MKENLKVVKQVTYDISFETIFLIPMVFGLVLGGLSYFPLLVNNIKNPLLISIISGLIIFIITLFVDLIALRDVNYKIVEDKNELNKSHEGS